MSGAITNRCRGLFLALAAVVTVAVGCRAQIAVDVVVSENGSGQVAVTVIADREAASALIDLGDEGLRVDDLVSAGWTLTPPSAGTDGSVTTTATKPFGTPEQFHEIMDELSGPDGLFQDFQLVRERSFARVDFVVQGRISPQDVDVFGDDALSEVLGERLVDLVAEAGGSAADVDVAVTVQVPGALDSDDSSGIRVPTDRDDTAAEIWRTRLDASTPTDVRISSSTQQVAALVWRGIAVLAGVLAALVLLGHLLRLLRPERRRGGRRSGRSGSGRTRRPPPAGGRGNGPAAGDQPAEKSRPTDKGANGAARDRPRRVGSVAQLGDGDVAPRLVALDGMGVLYREGEDIARLLVPFVRERGSVVSNDEIVARARSLSLGRITTADFWSAVGVEGDPNQIDDDYLSLFQLNPGVVRFLRALRAEGVRVACVTNDCTTWANKLRARHSLDGLIAPWVVSGAVGVRKPDAPIFEALRRVTREVPAAILVVDDNLDNLDAARALGFATAWFAPEAPREQARGHSILRSFAVADRGGEGGDGSV